MLRDKIKEVVLEKLDYYFEIVKDLYNHPEIGLKEFHAQKVLTEALLKEGFDVIKGYALETDFIASYDSLKEGPTIAYMAEYDALPGIGHGCGHNMICNISILAATALKSVIDEMGGKVLVIGTPAEENFGGKVKLSAKGAFDNVDFALMIHPASRNGVGSRSNAIVPLKFIFHGKNAHACAPYNGASALDACVQTYQGINMLRQFIKPSSFIHGIIRDGGEAANIIPDYASLEYYFRGDTIEYATYLKDRAIEICKGACIQTNCTYELLDYEETYCDTLINYTLANKLKEEMELLGLSDVYDVNEELGGSTDVGNVSYICPTIQGNIKICDDDINGHSREFRDKTISKDGYEALKNAALSLAYLGYDLISDKEFSKNVKEEFKNSI